MNLPGDFVLQNEGKFSISIIPILSLNYKSF